MTNELTLRQALMREAAQWLTKLDAGTADVAAFEAWRDADPRHAAAIARLVGVNHALDRARPHLDLEDVENVKGATTRRNLLWGVGTAAAGFVAIGGAVTWTTSRASAVTGVGDRQSIAVPGAGRLDLNTDTKVFYRFSTDRNRIWLERGEIALTQTAGQVPCEIVAGADKVELRAGKINAHRVGEKLQVLVQVGDCTVRQDNARRTTVVANQAATIAPQSLAVAVVADADQQFATGWQNDELMLDGQTLSAAVDEFNRYQPEKIEIGDPAIADIHLGGRFSLHDPNEFLAALQSSFGIHAARNAAGGVVLSR